MFILKNTAGNYELESVKPMSWICYDCGNPFDEPDTKRTSYEDIYGVGREFSGRTMVNVYICPYCKSDDIEEEEEE